MGERERAFRQRIARIARIQNLQEKYQNEETITENVIVNNFNEISPVINGIKKNIENFRTKESEQIEL